MIIPLSGQRTKRVITAFDLEILGSERAEIVCVTLTLRIGSSHSVRDGVVLKQIERLTGRQDVQRVQCAHRGPRKVGSRDVEQQGD